MLKEKSFYIMNIEPDYAHLLAYEDRSGLTEISDVRGILYTHNTFESNVNGEPQLNEYMRKLKMGITVSWCPDMTISFHYEHTGLVDSRALIAMDAINKYGNLCIYIDDEFDVMIRKINEKEYEPLIEKLIEYEEMHQ